MTMFAEPVVERALIVTVLLNAVKSVPDVAVPAAEARVNVTFVEACPDKVKPTA